MKKILLPLLALPLICLVIAGCEWSSGGGVTTWNDRENYVDFSGSYKAADGGVLVRKSGSGSGSTTNTTAVTNTVEGELLATGDGTTTAFSGALAHPTPLSGSLTIIIGGYRAVDPGTASAGTVALTITPADGTTGSLNFDTGVWTLNFPSAIAAGTQFLSAYQYLSSSTVVHPNQGNHGDPIYSFVIYQQGNAITILDNCNSKYEGYIGNVRNTGGQPLDVNGPNNQIALVSGPVNAQLYVTGYSQGYNVQITGVLQGTYAASSATLSGRTIKATFVEEGGYDADISGVAQ